MRIRKTAQFFFSVSIVFMFSFTTDVNAWWWKTEQSQDYSNAVELSWSDLIPSDYTPPENPLLNMSREQRDKLFDGSEESNATLFEIEERLSYAPVVPELDNRLVKIAGYVVPLEFDGQTELSEFLLVPYVGACLHTPPPPANQLIFVRAESTITIKGVFDPIWAIGILKTQSIESSVAESGYFIDLEAVQLYE